MSATSLLPAAAPPRRPVRVAHSSPLDIVHDHVLRLLGDEQAAVEATADVVMRAAGRSRDLGQAPTLRSLLRSAHARVAKATRHLPDKELADRLAGPGPRDAAAIVRAMTVPDMRGAALLLLTARLGIDIDDAAVLVGTTPAEAHAALGRARREVDEALLDAGTDVDVATALAHLPVIPAIDRLHDMLLADAAHTQTSVTQPVAWLGTAAVAVATACGVAFALPQLAEQDLGPAAPVVVAERVEDGPAQRQLASDDGESSEEPVEELVVSRSPSDEDEPATEEAAPSADGSEDSAEPAPEETPSEEPAPTDEDAPQDEEEPSDEPSEEPSEDPIELPLP